MLYQFFLSKTFKSKIDFCTICGYNRGIKNIGGDFL